MKCRKFHGTDWLSAFLDECRFNQSNIQIKKTGVILLFFFFHLIKSVFQISEGLAPAQNELRRIISIMGNRKRYPFGEHKKKNRQFEIWTLFPTKKRKLVVMVFFPIIRIAGKQDCKLQQEVVKLSWEISL